MVIPIIIIVVIALLIGLIISTYNSLVNSKNQVKNAWSQIDVELQRRFDLIPNLVETIKGYMTHEESVLTKVTELRSSWANSKSISEKAKLENELTSSLKSIAVVAEQYPDLKSNTNFLNLQDELASTETKISTSRAAYNNQVAMYNTKLEIFPNNILSKFFNFNKEEFFKVEKEEIKQNIKVSF